MDTSVTFQHVTKHGTFLVTVNDPTPSDEQIARERQYASENEAFRLDADSIVINGIPLSVHAWFKRVKSYKDVGDERVFDHYYTYYQGYGIRRTDTNSHELPEGVRKTINTYACEVLARITPEMYRAARVNRLYQEAERLEGEADTLRTEAFEKDAAAAEKRLEADRLK